MIIASLVLLIERDVELKNTTLKEKTEMLLNSIKNRPPQPKRIIRLSGCDIKWVGAEYRTGAEYSKTYDGCFVIFVTNDTTTCDCFSNDNYCCLLADSLIKMNGEIAPVKRGSIKADEENF